MYRIKGSEINTNRTFRDSRNDADFPVKRYTNEVLLDKYRKRPEGKQFDSNKIKNWSMNYKTPEETKKIGTFSDIFFFKNPSTKENILPQSKKQYKNGSNLSNSVAFTDENFRVPNLSNKKDYGITSLSKSDWEVKGTKNSLMTHTGYKYNIVAPVAKSTFFTKDGITRMSEIKPEKRKDLLCSFKDFRKRVHLNIFNETYRQAVSNSKSPFHKLKSYFTEYSDTCRSVNNILRK